MLVSEAQDRIDSREFAEYMASFELDPPAGERIELAIAKGNFVRFKGSKFEDWCYTPAAERPKDLGRRVLAIFGAAVAVAEARKKR